MEIKRTTEILIETERRVVVSRKVPAERIFCPRCGELMLAAEAAATAFNLSRRAVYQIVENCPIHFAETETGAVLICPSSLAAAVALRKDPPRLPCAANDKN